MDIEVLKDKAFALSNAVIALQNEVRAMERHEHSLITLPDHIEAVRILLNEIEAIANLAVEYAVTCQHGRCRQTISTNDLPGATCSCGSVQRDWLVANRHKLANHVQRGVDGVRIVS